MGTFSGLSASISGLFANKRALDTISHNIANINNPYYVRQQVIQSSSGYNSLAGNNMQVGTGVMVEEIRQLRDEFLDIKFRNHSQDLGYLTTKTEIFRDIQGIFNELSGQGLQNVMDQFWNSWEELSKHPDNLTMRGLLHERAVAFVETVNHMANQLDNLQININKDIKNKVDEVNYISKQIAALNKEITSLESFDVKANDYRDTRNQLLDRLSQIANISYRDDPTGAVNVLLGGQTLVNQSNYREIESVKNKSTFVDVYWKDTLTNGMAINPNSQKVNLQSGELRALIDGRGNVDSTIIGRGNGTVNDEVDVVFAVDVSDSNAANLANIQTAIENYRDDMLSRGLDVQISVIVYGDGAPTAVTAEAFQALGSFAFSTPLSTLAATGTDVENFDAVINNINGTTFRPDAHKKLVVFSDDNIGGAIDETGNIQTYLNDLNNLGISTTIVSDLAHKLDGDTVDEGWDEITYPTGGDFFDINRLGSGIDELARDLAQETSDTASRYMGKIEGYDEIIPNLRQKLNSFVNAIARNINYIHQQGKTLSGANGAEFFVASNSNEPIQAGNIKLNPLLNTLNNIAASKDGDRGDGEIAKSISDIRQSYIFADMIVDEYFRDIISDIGIAANEIDSSRISKQILLDQVYNNKTSISAVSLDEEMTKMLQYQHSYAANSRVVNAIDEMANFIINKMGIVGR